MRSLDLSSWQGVLSSLLGLALFALIGVGIRVLLTMTVQQRRERTNRQINERLKTLMAAYKVLGGSFTGDLTVDPSHLRDIRLRSRSQPRRTGLEDGGGTDLQGTALPDPDPDPDPDPGPGEPAEAREGDGTGAGSDRSRRIRDAVEAALSDILLLGTEPQVRLAARAVAEMVEGRPIHTAELVVSLRDFIRRALDLDPIPADVRIPLQGPARPAAGGGGGRSGSGDKGGKSGGGGSGDGGGAGGGAVMMGIGTGRRLHGNEEEHRETGHGGV